MFDIASIDNNTQITLAETWTGKSVSGVNYFIVNPLTVNVQNLTLQNSSGGQIFQGCVDSLIQNILMKDDVTPSTGISMIYCCSTKVNGTNLKKIWFEN